MLAVGSKPGGPFTRVDKGTYTLADAAAIAATTSTKRQPATKRAPARKNAAASKPKTEPKPRTRSAPKRTR